MTLSYALGFIKAATKTHETLLHSSFHWPLMMFDTTPLGRILNRFSNDINILDNVLPMTLQAAFGMLFTVNFKIIKWFDIRFNVTNLKLTHNTYYTNLVYKAYSLVLFLIYLL